LASGRYSDNRPHAGDPKVVPHDIDPDASGGQQEDGSDTTHLIELTRYDDPLPSPKTLADFEKAYPGAAEWILTEARAAASHARNIEAKAIAMQATDDLLVRLLPFAAVTILIAASVLIAVFASPVLGGTAFLATLASVVTAYLKSQSAG
jgi:uncharacterized membrane protein